MRNRPMLLLALTLAMLATVSVVPAQTPDPLQQTLASFQRAPHPMRDPRRVKMYTTLQAADGQAAAGWDHAIWLRNMVRDLPQLARWRNALDEDHAIFQGLLDETGKELQAKAAATTQAQLDKFNGRSTGRVLQMLKAYRLVRSKQAAAALAEAAAYRDVQSAIAAVDRDAAIVQIKANGEELIDLDKRQKAIMDKVKKAAWIKDAYSTVKGAIATVTDPSALKEYLIDKTLTAFDEALMNNVLMEHAEELKAIETRTAAVQKALETAKDTEVRRRLNASQEALAAARLRLIKAGVERTIASIEGWDYIDELAALERSYKCTDVFTKLQDYNSQVRAMGDAFRVHNANMIAILDDGAANQAASVVKSVEKDIAFGTELNRKTTSFASGMGGDHKEWLETADRVRVYATSQAEWYRSEKAACEREIAAVLEGKHLVLVEATVSRINGLLGNTTGL